MATRGFAGQSPERRREIASTGGKRAHADGTAHQFTVEEARAAGAKGGAAVSADREHMRRLGRRGGAARKKLPLPASTAPMTEEVQQ